MNSRLLILILAIASMGGFTWWVDRLTKELEDPSVTDQGDRMDFYMHDYHVSVTNEAGALLYEASGTHLEHWQKSEEVIVTNPRLTFYPEEGPPVYLRSESGFVPQGAKTVELRGEVVLDREAYGTHDSLHAVTSNMTIWPEEERGHTDEFAYAEGKRYRAEGTGMTIDLAARTLELHSKARGTYEN